MNAIRLFVPACFFLAAGALGWRLGFEPSGAPLGAAPTQSAASASAAVSAVTVRPTTVLSHQTERRAADLRLEADGLRQAELLSAWLRDAPEEVIRGLLATSAGEPDELLEQALGQWVGMGGGMAALDLALAMSEAERQTILPALAYHLAAHDAPAVPGVLAKVSASMLPEPMVREIRSRLAWGAGTSLDFERATQWLESMPESIANDPAAWLVISQRAEPAQVLAWISARPNHADLLKDAASAAFSRWSYEDTAAASAWLSAHPGTNFGDEAAAMIASMAANLGDATAFAAWSEMVRDTSAQAALVESGTAVLEAAMPEMVQ